MNLVIWTIGHSSQPIERFLALLASQQIERLADVRRYAGSRANPQFNPEPLARSLAARHVEYVPFPELGGRRAPSPSSRNTIWRNTAFRAYADFMETPDFHAGLARLVEAAAERRTAMMCSEAVWWRCHRSLIADALKVRGVRVLHIMSESNVTEHPYTSAARVSNGALLYGPAPE
ncbi:MAG TPA: DUF488 domain-containing protein [Rhodothermales bacterium]|nr:DUF488 domain-containing protein [Rhodothermales bacterium]